MITGNPDDGVDEKFPVQSLKRKAFATRLREAFGEQSGHSISRMIQTDTGIRISPTSVNQYLAGAAEPRRPYLIVLAQVAGVTVEWLATGQGPKHAGDESRPAAQAVDEELQARIYEGVSRAYKEANARISPADQGRMAARITNELVAAYDDPAERLVGLKLALERLRAELRAAPIAGESSGKRSA